MAFQSLNSSDNFPDTGGLWALGHAARLAKEAEAARQFLRALRLRYPASGRASKAAFLLGKIAVDVDGDLEEARRMLRTYLNEAPNGSLAEAALGQLLEVSTRQERTDEARKLAEESLRRFPGGIYSEKANAVLSQ